MKKRFTFKRTYGLELLNENGTELRYFCHIRSLRYFPYLRKMRAGERIAIDIELIPISKRQTGDYEIFISYDASYRDWDFHNGNGYLTCFLSYQQFRKYYKGIKKSAYYGVIIHY